MKVFVTGATGLLGSNLTRQLVQQGHSVTALVRNKERAARQLRGLDITFVEGDMADVAAFAPALSGHEVLYHTAAFFREYYQPGNHWEQLKRINIDGTIALLRAAEAQGVGKVVYASSNGVIGRRSDGTPGDESTPPDQAVHENLYFKSKVVAEEEITAFLKTSTLPVVLILPAWMWGPSDWAPTGSGQVVLDFLNKNLPVGVPGGGAPVDARDVAAAMIAAAERGRSGERYIIGGDNHVTMRELFTTLEELSGVPGPRTYPPLWLVYTFAWLSETVGRLTGQPTTVTVAGVRVLQSGVTTSSAKAVRELGITFRPFRDTLRDEVAWFRTERPDLLKGEAGRAVEAR